MKHVSPKCELWYYIGNQLVCWSCNGELAAEASVLLKPLVMLHLKSVSGRRLRSVVDNANLEKNHVVMQLSSFAVFLQNFNVFLKLAIKQP